MVAKIDTNDRLDKTLNYNEAKVAQESAELIYSSGFLKDTDRLTFNDKFERFQRQNELNPNAKVNTLHAKVSFDPSEKLSNETLQRIAKQYMEGIGFGDQPYLVYRHNDTQVPHIHIVSTMITPEGKRIRDYNIGKDKSEPTREAIEKDFDLVRAKDHAQVEEHKYAAVDLEKVIHGEEPTKKAIQNRLKTILDEYNVTSLSELNAILRGYNIQADPGEPGSRKRQHGGLTYKVQDDKGNTAGIPIKASDFYFKPTLDKLKEKFEIDKEVRDHKLENVRNRVATVLHQKPKSLEQLAARLRKENIDVVVWSNDSGKVYGITFVDHDNKIAVKGSEMGKEYSAKSILTTIAQNAPDNTQQQSQPQNQQQGQRQNQQQNQREGQQKKTGQSSNRERTGADKPQMPLPDGRAHPRPPRGIRPEILEVPQDHNRRSPHLLEQLLQSRSQGDSLPNELSHDKKKKKRKKRSH